MKIAKYKKYRLAAITILVAISWCVPMFPQAANSSSWIYPDGNLAATKYNDVRSRSQQVDSFKLKWMSNIIRGDVQPLIGNIVQNSAIIQNSPEFPYAPNEITAVIGDTLVILDGAGKILTKYPLRTDDQSGNDIIAVSALLDTLSSLESPTNANRTLILGLESIESQRPDSLAVAYLGGWKTETNDFSFLSRLALNLRYDSVFYQDYLPNYSASIKPIYARKRYIDDFGESNDTSGYMVFATANMSQPSVTNDENNHRPYFRGLTAFELKKIGNTYPMPDAGDRYEWRVHLGPQVSFAQPSISNLTSYDTSNHILLPCLPTPVGDNRSIENSIFYSDNGDVTDSIVSYPEMSYLFNYRIDKQGDPHDDGNGTIQLIDEVNSRPRIRSYYLRLTDANDGYENTYILATTEYNNVQNNTNPISRGRSGLFLFDFEGNPLYDFYATADQQYMLPFFADSNHYWSIATGNVDGSNSNSWTPYYPNNPGNEIIATQSSRDFAYAGSRLMIIRYNSSPYLTPKVSPPNTSLKNFDTICTFPIQGWVAAVNNIDGNDNKDEILIVDASKIIVLRMNDYNTTEFRSGKYFDTVFIHQFGHQTITSAAIADVDGDGKNDLIITTNEGIYIMGTPLERTIDITGLSPSDEYQKDWCFGDTVHIRWKNIIQGNSEVNVLFQECNTNGQPIDTAVMLAANYPNANDTAVYDLVIDTTFAGKSGKVIIQSVSNPTKNVDTTGILHFHKPELYANVGSIDTLYVGSKFTIRGTVSCTDSVKLYYSFDSIQWIHIADAVIDSLDNFTIETQTPCLPIFSCADNKVDTIIFGKIIYSRYSSVDETTIFPLHIKPARFTLAIDSCQGACPTRTIHWQFDAASFLDAASDTTTTNNDSLLQNSTFNVYMSIDTGRTFQLIGEVPISIGMFEWNVPTNVTTPVIVRFCNDAICYQTDTTISDYKPSYIKIVAPNPLKIPQIADIVYQVNEDTDVTIRIIDQNNHYVKTLIENERKLGGFAYCEQWDGRLDDKTPCSNGMFYIYLKMSNGIEEIYPIYIRN